MKRKILPEPANVLYRIKRGLAGYISYLAACEMNPSFSEYLLYEPILRILTARGFIVECEVECPGASHSRVGDKKRLDFVARKGRKINIALEVKWMRTNKLDVKKDTDKLKACLTENTSWRAFLIVFGRKSCISRIRLPRDTFKEKGEKRIANLGTTKFGCRVYELIGGTSVRSQT